MLVSTEQYKELSYLDVSYSSNKNKVAIVINSIKRGVFGLIWRLYPLRFNYYRSKHETFIWNIFNHLYTLYMC